LLVWFSRTRCPFSLDAWEFDIPLHVGGTGVVVVPWTKDVDVLPSGAETVVETGATGCAVEMGATVSVGDASGSRTKPS